MPKGDKFDIQNYGENPTPKKDRERGYRQLRAQMNISEGEETTRYRKGIVEAAYSQARKAVGKE